jgi:hypothetical protein
MTRRVERVQMGQDRMTRRVERVQVGQDHRVRRVETVHMHLVELIQVYQAQNLQKYWVGDNVTPSSNLEQNFEKEWVRDLIPIENLQLHVEFWHC